MISPTIPKRPKRPILTKKEILTPLIKIKLSKVRTITIAVPKSGSSIINPKKRKMIPKIGNTPFLILFKSF